MTKITIRTVEEYDSVKDQKLKKELQEDIQVFEEFIRLHKKELKNYANDRYPLKREINFIAVSINFSHGPGTCRSLEVVIYPATNVATPNKNDYLVESFSTDDIGGRKVWFKVFRLENKKDS
jgi:hypothetical protein